METLTKEQLNSITPKQIKEFRKIKAILANMDITAEHPQYIELAREGLAAKALGLTYKQVEKILDERAKL